MLSEAYSTHSGIQLQPLQPAASGAASKVGGATPNSRSQKLTKVAQEFEGILLSSLLDEIQKGTLDPSQSSLGAGSETLRSLGTQAVAQALAQRGGLGIAKMIVRHFTPRL